MTEKHITTKQGNVYYWVSEAWDKEKDTMFFFPGLTADHTMFESQFEYFSKWYNLIAWDAPCHGKSRPYEEFSFDHTSDAILQILEENDMEDMIAIGQSLGGYYIQAFTLRHPRKVKAFVGIGTTPYGEIYYSKLDKFWLRQVEWMAMCCPLRWMKKAAAKQATCTEAGYQNMMSMTVVYGKREYSHLMQIAYAEFLQDNRDFDIPCPVLITYGERDKVGKVKQYCRMWHKQTKFPLVVIKDAGHNANVDNPQATNEIIERFLKKRRTE